MQYRMLSISWYITLHFFRITRTAWLCDKPRLRCSLNTTYSTWQPALVSIACQEWHGVAVLGCVPVPGTGMLQQQQEGMSHCCCSLSQAECLTACT